MTRINAFIPVASLCDAHLLAEHREIKRIPNAVKSGKAKLANMPKEFRLGKGHVKFFYNKIGYLKNRYIALHKECCKRGFNVSDYTSTFENVDAELCNDWTFNSFAQSLVKERINERLTGMRNIKHNRKTITSDAAISMINNRVKKMIK